MNLKGPDRSRHVLDQLLAEIVEGVRCLVPDLASHCTRDADATGRTQALKPGSYIRPVPENVALVDDEVADIQTHPEDDPLVFRHSRIAVAHGPLHLDRAGDRFDGTGELYEHTVACGFHEASVVPFHRRINNFATNSLQARMRPGLIHAH